MKFRKITTLILSTLLITSCGGGDNKKSGAANGELTGIWQLEMNNILHSINHNGNNVTINVCNEDSPFTLTKGDTSIKSGDDDFFTINNSTQLEISSGPLEGVKLNKISDTANFNSGSISIISSNISNLETSDNVCAYRESDNMYNAIAAPYLDGYLLITLGVDNEAAGDFTIPYDISLSLESDQLPGGEISANSGEINVTVYSSEKLEASFTFTAEDGNEYTGSVNVDI